MNRVLHYLRFDWKHWRMLLLALWSLVAARVVLAWLVQREKEHGVWLSSLENSIQACSVLAAGCAVVMAVLAGGADSPVAGTSFLMTRPCRRRALVAARVLLIFAGVVLPLAVCQALALAVLDFNGATVREFLGDSVPRFSAAAGALMLWALVKPCFPGVVVGAGAAGLLALLMFIPALRPRTEWMEAPPAPLVITILLGMAALAGLRGVWRRQNRRQWAWSGFGIGFLTMAAVVMAPAVEYARRILMPGRLARQVFERRFGDWELSLKEPGPVQPSPFLSKEATWDFPLQIPRLPEGISVAASNVEAVAWRDGPDTAWSDWLEARGAFYIATRERDWLLSITCDPRKVPPIQNGELRVKTRLELQRKESPVLPLRPGAFVRGEGWTMELLGLSQDSRGSFSWTTLARTGGIADAQMPRALPDWGSGEASFYGASDKPGTRPLSMGITTAYMECSRELRDAKAPPRPLPEFLRVHNTAVSESCRKTVHLKGITLLVPEKETVPDAPPLPWQPTPPDHSWTGTRNERGPRPWMDSVPEIPGAAASEIEVAVFLDVLTEGDSPFQLSRRAVEVSTPQQEARLAALVPRWLPLFIETLARNGDQSGDLLAALVAGTAEGQRGELLRRIPDAPPLAEVAMKRGWEAEAKPFVLQLVQGAGRIPTPLESLCRSYRDPAFHPAMRRRFTADVPTVRYWESMPDLAAKLPEQLAHVRDYLMSPQYQGHPLEDTLDALLYTGDAASLELLLRLMTDGSTWDGWPAAVFVRQVRDSDGNALNFRAGEPKEQIKLQSWIGDSTAAEYVFQPERRCFVRKPKSPKP